MRAKEKTDFLVSALLGWFSKNARQLPWRKTSDPYAIWISEIMLQQTQVKTVIPYWGRWLRELPTIDSLANASSEKIHKLWEGLGYYTRVRNLQKTAVIICEKHAGKFPETFEDVFALPGIGRYTAGAICSIAFNQTTAILDGNVIRVLTRVFGIRENPHEKKTNVMLWKLAKNLVLNSKFKTQKSKLSCSHLNQSLMELGALICTPRQPKCLLCPLQKKCVARLENLVEKIPNLGERIKPTARRFVAFLVERRGKFFVRQRRSGIVNAHLWEFPNIEVFSDKMDFTNLPGPFFLLPKFSTKPVCQIKHSITRYRISLEVFRARFKKNSRSKIESGEWRTLEELDQFAFTSAHRKILRRLC
ncbi:MAG: A/G-specific adenine glycosylase [Verrucomicrobiota bacterium]|nr:A/G-specific adenine glycosylase [Verrucomicrobiota bacterium]